MPPRLDVSLTICGAALSAVVSAGCAAADGSGADAVIRDSAGITIVENPAARHVGHAWSVDTAPSLEIGRAEGAGADVFGRIRHVVRVRAAIFVADAIGRTIQEFDAEGRHVRTLGGPGEGPGEFSNLWWIFELPPDSLAAVDNLNARVSVFAPGGAFARSYPIPRVPGAAATNIVGRLGDGTLVATALSALPRRTTADTSTIFLFTIDRTGTIAGRLGEQFDRRLGRNGLGMGFGGSAEIAADDRAVWYAHSGTFELRMLAPDGSLRRIVRLEREPVAVTAAEVARARAVVEESLRRQNASGRTAQRIRETEYAETHPLHGRLLVDETGHLWVAHARNHLADEAAAPVEAWDVFDPDGRLLGHLETPAGFEAMQIGRDFLLGIHTDSLGVGRVQLYSLQRR